VANEKVVLADLSGAEARAFGEAFSRKAALKDAFKQITEAIAVEQTKEDVLWAEARRRYNIPDGAIHVNVTEMKIYAGLA
jgi:hypothetical protein